MALFGLGFWRRAAQNPDAALRILAAEPGCIVDGNRKPGHAGPFFLLDTAGRRHRVYINSETIDEIQTRVGRILEETEAMPRKVDLTVLAKQFRGRRLAQLVLEHCKLGQEQCINALFGLNAELPTRTSDGVIELIDVVNAAAMQDGNAFFSDDLGNKFDELIRVVRGFYRKRHATELTDDQAFTLFNILILNWANACFTHPTSKAAMQKAAGIGFLGRLFR